KISWRPYGLAPAECERRVGNERRRSKARLAGRESRAVDERLERRPGLAAGVNGAIELALPIISAADEGPNLAVGRVQGDQDRLKRFAGLAPAKPWESPLELGESGRDGVLCDSLQIPIERCDDRPGTVA